MIVILIIIIAIITIIIGYVLIQFGNKPDGKQFVNLDYYNGEQFISPEELVFYPERTTGGSSGFARFFSKSPNALESELPMVRLDKHSFSTQPEEFALYWLGHSSAILELNGKRIMIDPVLENAAPFPGIASRYSPSPLKREDIPELDYVLITHDHYDHLEYTTIRELRNRNLTFIVPLGVGTRLIGWGVPDENITELGWDDIFEREGLSFTALKGVHYSGRSKWDRNSTLWCSYVIRNNDMNIFWNGDTGYGNHFTEIGNKYGPFDLAAIEIDGWNHGWPNTHLFPEEAVKVAKKIRAEKMLPIHWAVFDLALHPWDESINSVIEFAERDSVNVITPLMGEKVTGDKTEYSRWWNIENFK